MAKLEFLKCATCANNEAPILENGVYVCKYCKNQRERKQNAGDEITVNGDGNFTMANVHNTVIGNHTQMTIGEKICHFIMMGRARIVDAKKFKEVDTYLRSCIPTSRIDKYNSLITKGDERDFWYVEIFLTAYSDLEPEFATKISEMLLGINIVPTLYAQENTNKGNTTTTISVNGNGNTTYSNITNSIINIDRK